MEKIWSVLIKYKVRELRPYICLSQFFTWCGFVVGDGRYENEEDDLELASEEYLFILSLSKHRNSHDIHSIFFEISDILPEDLANESNRELEQSKYSKLLISVLKLMRDKAIISDEKCKVLLVLAELYVKNTLNIHEYNCRQYFYAKEPMQRALGAYQKVESHLFGKFKEAYINEKYEIIPFIQYARCYCGARINGIADKLNTSSRYDFFKISRILEEIIQTNPQFSAGYYLLGQMYEQKGKWRAAYQTYQIYRMRISQKEILSDVCYRLGKTTEELYNLRSAYAYYKKSYEIRHNYPAQYKVAVYEEFVRRDYTKAAMFYAEMVRYFTESVQYENMQPQELEYLFKLYFRQGRLWLRRKKNMTEAKKCFVKAEHLEHITLEQMKFLVCFYGNEADEYLDLLIRRMPMNQIRINRQEAEWRQHAD